MMAERLGLDVIPLRSEWGKSMDPNILQAVLEKNKDVKLVSSIHAETSTGVLQPVDELAKISHKFGAFFMTDVVTSLSGSELYFDDWGIENRARGIESETMLIQRRKITNCKIV